MTGFNIAEVFTQSLRFVLKQLRALAVFAAVPYALLLAALFLIDMATADMIAQFVEDMAAFQRAVMEMDPSDQAAITVEGLLVTMPDGQSLDFGPMLLANLITMLAVTIVPLPFRVAWMRYSLLGPQAEPVRIGYAFGPRTIRFLGYTLGLIVIMAVILFVFAAIGGMVGGGGAVLFALGGIGVTIWVAARLYFVYPAVAMDLPGGFGRAWRESRGQAFRLFALTLLIALVFLIPSLIVSLMLGQVPILGPVAMLLMQILVEAALWTALAFAYWKTTGIPGPGGRLDVKAFE